MVKVLHLASLLGRLQCAPLSSRGGIHGGDPSICRGRNRLFCTSGAMDIVLGIVLDTWEIQLVVVGVFLGVEISPLTILVSKGCPVPKLTRLLPIIFHFLLTVE